MHSWPGSRRNSLATALYKNVFFSSLSLRASERWSESVWNASKVKRTFDISNVVATEKCRLFSRVFSGADSLSHFFGFSFSPDIFKHTRREFKPWFWGIYFALGKLASGKSWNKENGRRIGRVLKNGFDSITRLYFSFGMKVWEERRVSGVYIYKVSETLNHTRQGYNKDRFWKFLLSAIECSGFVGFGWRFSRTGKRGCGRVATVCLLGIIECTETHVMLDSVELSAAA